MLIRKEYIAELEKQPFLCRSAWETNIFTFRQPPDRLSDALPCELSRPHLDLIRLLALIRICIETGMGVSLVDWIKEKIYRICILSVKASLYEQGMLQRNNEIITSLEVKFQQNRVQDKKVLRQKPIWIICCGRSLL